MKPTAAPPIFPYPDHRTMAEVMAEEERLKELQHQWYNDNRKSWRRAG